MTETKAFITIGNTDADADAAYDRVLPEAQALPSEKLVTINIDVSAALITAMGVAERLPGLQQDLQTVSPALATDVSKYADYVLALFSAQSRFAMATTPPAQLPELLAEATKWRDTLLADARALSVRGQLNTEPLNELSGSHGYKNVAFDLSNLTRVFETSWASIEGKNQLTMSELQQAERVSLKLAGALAHRALSPEQVAAATDIRQRVSTLFYELYDEIRRAVSYLRWHHEDVDNIIALLYAGRGGHAKVASKTNGDANAADVASSTPPAVVIATPRAVTSPAAKVTMGHPGGDPLMSA